MPVHIAASSRNDRQNCTKLQNSAKVIQVFYLSRCPFNPAFRSYIWFCFKMLIENSNKLCGIPHCLANRLVSVSTTSLIDNDRGRRNSRDKRRHRRSSSFNRTSVEHIFLFLHLILWFILGVFEGLRKIVGVKSDFSASVEHLADCRSESAADLAPLMTSPIIRSTIKRKVDVDVNSGFSIKKK